MTDTDRNRSAGSRSRNGSGQSKRGVGCKKRRKTSVSECDGSATAQAELERAFVDADRAVVGGRPSVEGRSKETEPVRLMDTCASNQQTCPRGTQRPKILAEHRDWDAFRPWHSQNTLLGANSINKLDQAVAGRRASAALQQQQTNQ